MSDAPSSGIDEALADLSLAEHHNSETTQVGYWFISITHSSAYQQILIVESESRQETLQTAQPVKCTVRFDGEPQAGPSHVSGITSTIIAPITLEAVIQSTSIPGKRAAIQRPP